MLNPVEVNSKYAHLHVVRTPEQAKYIFDSVTERTYRFQKVIDKEAAYYGSVTETLYLPIRKTPISSDRWYFVR